MRAKNRAPLQIMKPCASVWYGVPSMAPPCAMVRHPWLLAHLVLDVLPLLPRPVELAGDARDHVRTFLKGCPLGGRAQARALTGLGAGCPCCSLVWRAPALGCGGARFRGFPHTRHATALPSMDSASAPGSAVTTLASMPTSPPHQGSRVAAPPPPRFTTDHDAPGASPWRPRPPPSKCPWGKTPCP